MATLFGNTVWEGILSEGFPTYAEGARDGHFFKALEEGESYIRVNGSWEHINLGLAFIKATKSGRITTDANGFYRVFFNTPFINADYGVTLTVENKNWGVRGGCAAYKLNKTINSFDILTKDTNNNQRYANVTVSWLCTRVYNP